jgi:hypothetical protein
MNTRTRSQRRALAASLPAGNDALQARHEAAQRHLVGYLVGLANAQQTCSAIAGEIEAAGGQAPASVLPAELADALPAIVDETLRGAQASGIVHGVRADANGLLDVV